MMRGHRLVELRHVVGLVRPIKRTKLSVVRGYCERLDSTKSCRSCKNSLRLARVDHPDFFCSTECKDNWPKVRDQLTSAFEEKQVYDIEVRQLERKVPERTVPSTTCKVCGRTGPRVRSVCSATCIETLRHQLVQV